MSTPNEPRVYAIIEEGYTPYMTHRNIPRLELHRCVGVCTCKRLLCVPFVTSDELLARRLFCIYLAELGGITLSDDHTNFKWNQYFTKHNDEVKYIFKDLENHPEFIEWPMSEVLVPNEMWCRLLFDVDSLALMPRITEFLDKDGLELKLSVIMRAASLIGITEDFCSNYVLAQQNLKKQLLRVKLLDYVPRHERMIRGSKK